MREVVPRGKHMLIRLADGRTLRTHFRMDGSWHIYRPGTKWRGGPAFAVRAILATDQWECVGYRLHDMAMVATAHEDQLVGHLGPDVLGPDWDLDEALRRLRSAPDEQIGVAILDQRNLAGIGNLYKVESLFLCGVHPWARVADVADLAAPRRAGAHADAGQPRPPRAEHHRRHSAAGRTTGWPAARAARAGAAGRRSCSVTRARTCRSASPGGARAARRRGRRSTRMPAPASRTTRRRC